MSGVTAPTSSSQSTSSSSSTSTTSSKSSGSDKAATHFSSSSISQAEKEAAIQRGRDIVREICSTPAGRRDLERISWDIDD